MINNIWKEFCSCRRRCYNMLSHHSGLLSSQFLWFTYCPNLCHPGRKDNSYGEMKVLFLFLFFSSLSPWKIKWLIILQLRQEENSTWHCWLSWKIKIDKSWRRRNLPLQRQASLCMLPELSSCPPATAEQPPRSSWH